MTPLTLTAVVAGAESDIFCELLSTKGVSQVTVSTRLGISLNNKVRASLSKRRNESLVAPSFISQPARNRVNNYRWNM